MNKHDKLFILSRVNVANSVLLCGSQGHLVTEEISNIANTVVDHGGAFQAQTPGDDTHILGESHGTQHLWAEDTGVTDFDPFLELWVVTEDLKTGLGVGVIGRLIFQVGDADLGVEFSQDTKQVRKTNISISDETFNLMELSQVSGIKVLISVDSIDGEVLHWLEHSSLLIGLSQLVKHSRADSGGVSTQQVLLCLVDVPVVLIAN